MAHAAARDGGPLRWTTAPSQRFYGWFSALCVLVGVLAGLGYYRDEYRPWKDYQRRFIAEEVRRAASPEQRLQAMRTPIQIRQILLPELNRVDRCTTCHLAVEDPSYGGYPQPLAYHPRHDEHPFDKFGCTICHRGQGRATTAEDAHGNVAHWDQPMLPLKYIEASCGQCHEAADNPAAPRLGARRAGLRDRRLPRLPQAGRCRRRRRARARQGGCPPLPGLAEGALPRARRRHAGLRHAAAEVLGA